MKAVGTMSDFNIEDCVAIIGPRKASKEEYDVAYHLAQKVVQKGKIVVSGLAEGIDTYAHQGAIDAGGKTIAILSTSEDEPIYPKSNKQLAEKIKNNGCLIYPFELSAKEADKRFGKIKHKKQRYILRLLERDILLASICPYIMAVSEKRVTGGTRWGMNYGLLFNHSVQQFGKEGRAIDLNFNQNVVIDWEMELTIQQLEY